MTTDLIPFADLTNMAITMSKSGMFGKTPEQMLSLMMIAQAEGQHPAIAALEYDVIQGRPALKGQAALARFQAAGGRVEYKERSDTACEATFTHPAGGSLTVRFTIEMATRMGLSGKDNWKKQPDIMLQWRCVAQGIRAVLPSCLNRMYMAEEVQDFENLRSANIDGKPTAFEIEKPFQPTEPAPQQAEPPTRTPDVQDAVKTPLERIDEAKAKVIAILIEKVGEVEIFTRQEKELAKTQLNKYDKDTEGYQLLNEKNAVYFETLAREWTKKLQDKKAATPAPSATTAAMFTEPETVLDPETPAKQLDIF